MIEKNRREYETYRFTYTNGKRIFHHFPSREHAVAYAMSEGDHLIDFEKISYEEG